MNTSDITLVILRRGSGTRLRPLSHKRFPKQFAPLIDGKSPLLNLHPPTPITPLLVGTL
jgi:mannose-1-phosphate guanylyltransferase/mannose-6-phosphate isomerase